MAALAACGPSTPDELLEAAKEAISDAEPRAAEIHLKTLLRELPENAEARRLLGELQLSALAGSPAAS